MDISLFKKAMGRNVTGVTVVTSTHEGERHGMTVNAFLSVSLAPPTMLVSLSKKSRTAELVAKGRVFSINLLADSQSLESDRFAGRHKDKEGDRFEGFKWKDGRNGCPVLAGSLGHLDCKVVHAYDGGDHTLFLGEVVAGELDDGRSPLVYSIGKYLKLTSFQDISNGSDRRGVKAPDESGTG